MSPKFKEENGFVFKIYSNEEERKHVHVIKAENEAKFWLEPNKRWQTTMGSATKK
ncbi:DUF4160 domain-containing protein [Xylanibacter rarus]|uniref:DUF4160 domain-containing protein n=1 Tax=Xylanibacter rarus TaxID=1676614 RepID=UPI003FEE8D7C